MKSVIYTLESRAVELQSKIDRDKAGVEMLSPSSRKQVLVQLVDHLEAIRKIESGSEKPSHNTTKAEISEVIKAMNKVLPRVYEYNDRHIYSHIELWVQKLSAIC